MASLRATPSRVPPTLAIDVGDRAVTTIEGLARNGELADHLVFRIADLRGLPLSDPSPTLTRIDEFNAAIATRTARALGLR